jgi:hypothetical protein
MVKQTSLWATPSLGQGSRACSTGNRNALNLVVFRHELGPRLLHEEVFGWYDAHMQDFIRDKSWPRAGDKYQCSLSRKILTLICLPSAHWAPLYVSSVLWYPSSPTGTMSSIEEESKDNAEAKHLPEAAYIHLPGRDHRRFLSPNPILIYRIIPGSGAWTFNLGFVPGSNMTGWRI